MKYFAACTTLEALKKEYRRLCMINHPDRGGDAATMAAINNEYDEAFHRLQHQQRTAQSTTTQATTQEAQTEEVPEEFRAVIEKLIRIQDIIIEICGSWIWVTGATYPHREELKAAGLRYSKSKVAWYWHPSTYIHRARRGYSLEEIRDLHGSAKISAATINRLTA